MRCTALSCVLERAARLQEVPHVLLLGELCGANVTFLGERGYRVSIGTDVRRQPEGSFAGALVWDAFSVVPPADARRHVAQLYDALAPGSAVLAVFGDPVSAPSRMRMRYRILSESSIRAESVLGRRGLTHPYQNKDIIQLFDKFDLESLMTRRNGQREALFFRK